MSAGHFQSQEQDCTDVFGPFILKHVWRLPNVGLDMTNFFFWCMNRKC